MHQTVSGPYDKPLLVISLVLLLFGLISVYTASAHQALQETGSSFTTVFKQLIAAVLGVVVMFNLSNVSFHIWRRAAFSLVAISAGLLLLTLVVGINANGSDRWLPLPFGFQFQPSELAKFAAICLLAQATSKGKLLNRTLMVALPVVGVLIALIYQQPNLSVALILSFLTLMMLFIGGFPVWLYACALPPAGYIVFQKIRATEYQWRRIVGWLNPWSDPQDAGYNLIQSYYAIGSGGILGMGFGHSIQKMYYLPFQHTDFIFSVICEELGLFGALIVLGLFGLLGWRGFTVAFNCPSRFGQMLAFGLTSSILLQALINISVTIGLMPTTGVPLPLISYGGTSVIMTLAMLGILLNISRYRLQASITG